MIMWCIKAKITFLFLLKQERGKTGIGMHSNVSRLVPSLHSQCTLPLLGGGVQAPALCMPSAAQRTGGDVLQAGHSHNVSSVGSLHVLAVVGMHHHEAANTLLLVAQRVEGVRASIQLACKHLSCACTHMCG